MTKKSFDKRWMVGIFLVMILIVSSIPVFAENAPTTGQTRWEGGQFQVYDGNGWIDPDKQTIGGYTWYRAADNSHYTRIKPGAADSQFWPSTGTGSGGATTDGSSGSGYTRIVNIGGTDRTFPAAMVNINGFNPNGWTQQGNTWQRRDTLGNIVETYQFSTSNQYFINFEYDASGQVTKRFIGSTNAEGTPSYYGPTSEHTDQQLQIPTDYLNNVDINRVSGISASGITFTNARTKETTTVTFTSLGPSGGTSVTETVTKTPSTSGAASQTVSTTTTIYNSDGTQASQEKRENQFDSHGTPTTTTTTTTESHYDPNTHNLASESTTKTTTTPATGTTASTTTTTTTETFYGPPAEGQTKGDPIGSRETSYSGEAESPTDFTASYTVGDKTYDFEGANAHTNYQNFQSYIPDSSAQINFLRTMSQAGITPRQFHEGTFTGGSTDAATQREYEYALQNKEYAFRQYIAHHREFGMEDPETQRLFDEWLIASDTADAAYAAMTSTGGGWTSADGDTRAYTGKDASENDAFVVAEQSAGADDVTVYNAEAGTSTNYHGDVLNPDKTNKAFGSMPDGTRVEIKGNIKSGDTTLCTGCTERSFIGGDISIIFDANGNNVGSRNAQGQAAIFVPGSKPGEGSYMCGSGNSYHACANSAADQALMQEAQTGRRWSSVGPAMAAATEAAGIGRRLSNLIMGEEDAWGWRRAVDEAFANDIGVMFDPNTWANSVCHEDFDRSGSTQGYYVADTGGIPGDLTTVGNSLGAHIEGTVFPVINVQDVEQTGINQTFNQSYIYRITLEVNPSALVYHDGDRVTFKVEVDGHPVDLSTEEAGMQDTVKIKKEEDPYRRLGNKAIIRVKSSVYYTACLKFEDTSTLTPDFKNYLSNSNNRICNKIQPSQRFSQQSAEFGADPGGAIRNMVNVLLFGGGGGGGDDDGGSSSSERPGENEVGSGNEPGGGVW